MPNVHNELRLMSALQRAAKIAFGLDAGSGGLERLSETIQVSKDLWKYPEDAFMRGEYNSYGSTNQAAVAGEYTQLGVAMMQTGWIGILEEMYLMATAAGWVNIGTLTASLATAGTIHGVLDNRKAPGSSIAGLPQARLSHTTNVAGLGTGFGTLYLAANTYTRFAIPFVFAGIGTLPRGFSVETQAVNVGLYASFRWRERQLLPGEFYL